MCRLDLAYIFGGIHWVELQIHYRQGFYPFLVQLGSCHKLVQSVPSSEKPGKEKGAFLCIALLLSAPCRSWKKLKFLEFLISFQALWVVIATIQLYKYPNCHKLQTRRNTNELMTLYNDVMPIWVVKFRGYGYKLKYIFGQKSTYYVGHCILWTDVGLSCQKF